MSCNQCCDEALPGTIQVDASGTTVDAGVVLGKASASPPQRDSETSVSVATVASKTSETSTVAVVKKRYTQNERATATFDAVEILGEKFPDPVPSLWNVLLHAIMHKPLLILVPAIPAALWMYAMACFPHCAITEEEVPLSGVSGALGLSRWGEWLLSRAIVSICMLGCAAFGPGLGDVRMMDRYAYGVTLLFHTIPFFLSTVGFVMATDCGTANSDLWIVVYMTVGDAVAGSSCFSLLCCLAVNRMRGMENWWNPMNIRKRSMRGFVNDLMGFQIFCNALVLAILYIAIDVAFVATSPAKGLRPVFTMILKKLCYMMASQGFARLGNTFKIWGLIVLSAVLGLNTAFAAVQCDSWESLGMFIILDCLSFLSRIWCHSGRMNKYKFGYYYRRYLIFGKSPPPDGIPTPVYRGFEIVIEGLGLSIGFATMFGVFFLSDPLISPYPMLRKMCFPYGWQSFYYLLAMMASDLVQDVAGVVWVGHWIRYDFSKLLGHPFASRNLPFMLGQASSWWAMCWLVQFGWLFQRLQVGPFAVT